MKPALPDDQEATWDGPVAHSRIHSQSAPCRPVSVATIAQHPDPRRIGERAKLDALLSGECALSRIGPIFARPGGVPAPLADVALSRTPTLLSTTPDGSLVITASPGSHTVVVNGHVVGNAPVVIDAAGFDVGVPITLANRVTLVVERGGTASPDELDDLGMIGASHATMMTRAQIAAVAPHEVPVLIRGETGTGKELTARALHRRSRRHAGPFIAVNMAALPHALAASELFGHVRGAFTGASQAHAGLFAQADGGTLFLDEIGDAPVEVQVMLLRAIETGEITPVGGTGARAVNVRLIAATDARLEAAVDQGAFRAPLYHRLAGYEVKLAPLRERRADIGPVLHHFLAEELDALGARGRLGSPDPSVPLWLDPLLLQTLINEPWPGNVRQLRNMARQLAFSSHDAPVAAWPTRRPDPPPGRPHAAAAASEGPTTRPSSLDARVVRDALEAHDFSLNRTARALGVARNTLNAWIERIPGLRRPRDITRQALEAALDDARGDWRLAASRLGVSERGLKLRYRELVGEAPS